MPDDDYRELCTDVLAGHVPAVRELQPDVVVAMVTFRDMEDRQWSAAEGVLTPSDQRFRQHLLDGYEWFATTMHAAGAGTVLFVVPPTPDVPAVGKIAPMLDPARIEAYRQVLRALPLSFTDGIAVADMAGWHDTQETHRRARRPALGARQCRRRRRRVPRPGAPRRRRSECLSLLGLRNHSEVRLGGVPAVGEQLLGLVVLDRTDDDDVAALLPVGRRGDLVLGGELQRVDDA